MSPEQSVRDLSGPHKRLSDHVYARMWTEILAQERTGELLAAWIAKEELRYLLAPGPHAARRDPAETTTRHDNDECHATTRNLLHFGGAIAYRPVAITVRLPSARHAGSPTTLLMLLDEITHPAPDAGRPRPISYQLAAPPTRIQR